MLPERKKRRLTSEEEGEEPATTTLFTPLTLIHRVGRGKDVGSLPICGWVVLLRLQHGPQRRPLYVVPSQTRPRPAIFEVEDEDEDEGVDNNKTNEDDDADDTPNRRSLCYETEKNGLVTTTFSTTGLRIAARALHNKDIAFPRFYFELDPLLQFDEKKSPVKDRTLGSIDDARVIPHRQRGGDPRERTSLWVRCRWARVSELPLPQTQTTWEPLETLLFVEEWRPLFEAFLCGSPPSLPFAGPPEIIADLHHRKREGVCCSLLRDPEKLFRLEDLSLELEAFLAMQAYQPFVCLVCGKETAEASSSSSSVHPPHKNCSLVYQTLRKNQWGKG
jgi:hypothetical protein